MAKMPCFYGREWPEMAKSGTGNRLEMGNLSLETAVSMAGMAGMAQILGPEWLRYGHFPGIE